MIATTKMIREPTNFFGWLVPCELIGFVQSLARVITSKNFISTALVSL
uniref:Uncharacterized protein n=1 Tax=Romanomermis culicivorax TaxID=13658 RepID=A0A915HND8_ROMCU